MRILLEQPQEPPRSNPRVPARILAGDEHGQVERVDRTEADLVYMSVQMALKAVGVTLKPPWSPAGQGGEKKLAVAYRNRGLNPKSRDL